MSYPLWVPSVFIPSKVQTEGVTSDREAKFKASATPLVRMVTLAPMSRRTLILFDFDLLTTSKVSVNNVDITFTPFLASDAFVACRRSSHFFSPSSLQMRVWCFLPHF